MPLSEPFRDVFAVVRLTVLPLLLYWYSAVQCMAVLRIDLFNGEIVGIFAVIAARLNRVYRFRIAHTLKVRNIVGRLPNPILRLPRGKGRAVTELIVRLAVPTNR